MPTDIQIIYTDTKTRRVGRIADYTSYTCPAELDGFTWQTSQIHMIPEDVFDDPARWTINRIGLITSMPGDISDDDRARVELLNQKAECLENLSKIVNIMRFRKSKNLFANAEVKALYLNEIENYKLTQTAGPLLMSLVDSADNLPKAISDFETANNEYNKMLITGEVLFNKWAKRIKQSDDPYDIFNSLKTIIGIM
jgi:hypothetical protein